MTLRAQKKEMLKALNQYWVMLANNDDPKCRKIGDLIAKVEGEK